MNPADYNELLGSYQRVCANIDQIIRQRDVLIDLLAHVTIERDQARIELNRTTE
jgi:hypothetical protein